MIDETLTISSLVPPEAGQGWKLELFELSELIPAHYHKVQRQLILVVEGELLVSRDYEETLLRAGELVYIAPGVVHSLEPREKARFFAIALPGFHFPEDVWHDQPSTIIERPLHKSISVQIRAFAPGRGRP